MSSIPLSSAGWVYAMVTSSHRFIKVGITTLDPHERARQLTSATASPTPLHVAHAKWHNDANYAESTIHEMLDSTRVNDSREFFSCSLYEAIRAIDSVCGADMGVGPRTPWAELFARFPDDGSARNLTDDEQAQCRELRRTLSL